MEETLTGSTRLRTVKTGIFNQRTLVVVQVETTWKDGPNDSNGLPEYLAGKRWRDATPDDICRYAIRATIATED